MGTGSARCGVFSLEGKLLASHAVPITMFQPPGSAYADYYQQSSANIWQAVCLATKTAIAEAGVAPADTVGIGFDATCSLVKPYCWQPTLILSFYKHHDLLCRLQEC